MTSTQPRPPSSGPRTIRRPLRRARGPGEGRLQVSIHTVRGLHSVSPQGQQPRPSLHTCLHGGDKTASRRGELREGRPAQDPRGPTTSRSPHTRRLPRKVNIQGAAPARGGTSCGNTASVRGRDFPSGRT